VQRKLAQKNKASILSRFVSESLAKVLVKLTATSADRDSDKGFMIAGSRKASITESRLA
jgi:hypothetical protein